MILTTLRQKYRRWNQKRKIFEHYGERICSEGIRALKLARQTSETPTPKDISNRFIKLISLTRFQNFWLARFHRRMEREEASKLYRDMVKLKGMV